MRLDSSESATCGAVYNGRLLGPVVCLEPVGHDGMHANAKMGLAWRDLPPPVGPMTGLHSRLATTLGDHVMAQMKARKTT